MVRPVSASGRPLTGFARPGTNRPTSSSAGRDVTTAMQGNRPGTSRPAAVFSRRKWPKVASQSPPRASDRPLTSMGRLIRLGTASMVNQDRPMRIAVLPAARLPALTGRWRVRPFRVSGPAEVCAATCNRQSAVRLHAAGPCVKNQAPQRHRHVGGSKS